MRSRTLHEIPVFGDLAEALPSQTPDGILYLRECASAVQGHVAKRACSTSRSTHGLMSISFRFSYNMAHQSGPDR